MSNVVKQLNTMKAKFKAEKARLESLLVQQQFRPCYNMPVLLRRDGAAWLCILEMAPDIDDCVHAYGNSPHQAMLNFDQAWYGQPVAGSQAVTSESDDEEDEYEESEHDEDESEW